MIAKILKWLGILVLLSGIGSYLFFAERISSKGRSSEKCEHIKIKILDKEERGFVTGEDVVSMIKSYSSNPVGMRRDEINIDAIEALLDRRSAIKKSQVHLSVNGDLNISITQRKPVLRIETERGGFYVDDTEYVFPLEKSFTSYVPIITGNLPLNLKENQRGSLSKECSQWIKGMTALGNYLQNNSFWAEQIEQIYIEENGELVLFPRSGPQRIIFGDSGNLEEKFEKLYTFYAQIVPVAGWNKYSEVNLKFRGEIICKRMKKKKSDI